MYSQQPTNDFSFTGGFGAECALAPAANTNTPRDVVADTLMEQEQEIQRKLAIIQSRQQQQQQTTNASQTFEFFTPSRDPMFDSSGGSFPSTPSSTNSKNSTTAAAAAQQSMTPRDEVLSALSTSRTTSSILEWTVKRSHRRRRDTTRVSQTLAARTAKATNLLRELSSPHGSVLGQQQQSFPSLPPSVKESSNSFKLTPFPNVQNLNQQQQRRDSQTSFQFSTESLLTDGCDQRYDLSMSSFLANSDYSDSTFSDPPTSFLRSASDISFPLTTSAIATSSSDQSATSHSSTDTCFHMGTSASGGSTASNFQISPMDNSGLSDLNLNSVERVEDSGPLSILKHPQSFSSLLTTPLSPILVLPPSPTVTGDLAFGLTLRHDHDEIALGRPKRARPSLSCSLQPSSSPFTTQPLEAKRQKTATDVTAGGGVSTSDQDKLNEQLFLDFDFTFEDFFATSNDTPLSTGLPMFFDDSKPLPPLDTPSPRTPMPSPIVMQPTGGDCGSLLAGKGCSILDPSKMAPFAQPQLPAQSSPRSSSPLDFSDETSELIQSYLGQTSTSTQQQMFNSQVSGSGNFASVAPETQFSFPTSVASGFPALQFSTSPLLNLNMNSLSASSTPKSSPYSRTTQRQRLTAGGGSGGSAQTRRGRLAGGDKGQRKNSFSMPSMAMGESSSTSLGHSDATAALEVASQIISSMIGSNFDRNTEPTIVTSFSDIILKVNESFGRLIGYAERELLGKCFLSLVHQDDKPAVAKSLAQISSTAGMKKMITPMKLVRKDGQVLWCVTDRHGVEYEPDASAQLASQQANQLLITKVVHTTARDNTDWSLLSKANR